MSDSKPPQRRSNTSVAEFLQQASNVPAKGRTGRLIFALDATASREATWDQAMHLQAAMFSETGALGGLAIQLCYYRGHREFYASNWVVDSQDLLRQMTGVRCRGGMTQIGQVLDHALRETQRQQVNAVVLIGDCVEEAIDPLCHKAGELALRGTPVFAFQEGRDRKAARGLTQIAELSGGACCPFDAGSAAQLRELLGAVAVFAAGGRDALDRYARLNQGASRLLTDQLSRS